MRSGSVAAALVLGLACALAFALSPRREAGDGTFALLTSASLAGSGSFDLDRVVPPAQLEGGRDAGVLRLVDGHTRIAAPPGTALLSMPFVPLLRLGAQGPPVVREARAGHLAASLLMGALAGVLFLLARVFVGPGASALVALAAVLGTPVWSVASRGLWSHTWAVLLLAIALLLVARAEVGGGRPRPAAVAVLLAAAYATRPDAVGAILPLAVHVARDGRQRRSFLAGLAVALTALGGVTWMQSGAFFVWPGLGVGVRLGDVPAQLMAQLASPSRGLVWFVPTVVLVAYLLARYRPPNGPLLRLGLVTIAAHALLQAWNHQWHGGYTYGPRMLVELVPFLALLAALGLAARRDAPAGARVRRAEAAWAALLVAAAVAMHARGAWSQRAWQWNSSPTTIDADPSRVWDWHEPQMLAGLVRRRPALFPAWPSGGLVDPASPQDARFFGQGWDAPERDFRWALGPEAELFFQHTEPTRPLLLRILGFPNEHPGGARQVLNVDLNGSAMGTLDVGRGPAAWRAVRLEASALRPQNVVRLAFPDAASPRALGQGDDERPLGFAVSALRLDRYAVVPADGVLRTGDDGGHAASGWGVSEDGWRRIEGTDAWLCFADPPPDASLLRVEVQGRGAASSLRVEMNGTALDALAVPADADAARTVVLPRGVLGPDDVLRFEPAAGADVAIRSVALLAMPAYPEERGIVPALPDADAHLLAGWSPRETDGSPFRWTDGREARIVFALDDPGRYSVLRLTLGGFIGSGLDAQRVQAILNGHTLAPFVVRNARAEEYPLSLPRGLLAQRNVLLLSLPDARSPLSLGIGDDGRVLGVAAPSG